MDHCLALLGGETPDKNMSQLRLPGVAYHQAYAEYWKKIHVETLIIHKLGFNQNYYTFSLILLTKIVPCSKFIESN